MASVAREILDLIEEIGGEAVARRAAKACSGRRLSMTAAALSRCDHPLRIVIGRALAMQLIGRLDATTGLRTVRFPEAKESAFLRDRRRRAAVIRRAVLDGQSVEATARAAKVHSRTVIYHRARLRAEGLLNSGGVHG